MSNNCYRLEAINLDSTAVPVNAVQAQQIVFDGISEKMRIVNQTM